MDDETKFVAGEEVETLLAGQDIETAVYGHRHYRQVQLMSEHEGATAETCHVAGEGAATLRKDHYGSTSLECFACLCLGTGNGLRSALVHHYVAGLLACTSYEGDAAQFLLHEPAETMPQIAVDKEDVVRSLMVGDEDITGILL